MSDLPDDLIGINQIDLISSAEGHSARTEMVYDIVNFEHTNLTTGNLNGAFGAALRFEDWKVLQGCVTLLECVQNSGTEILTIDYLGTAPLFYLMIYFVYIDP